MIFHHIKNFEGLCLIELEPYIDMRGLFSRTVCVKEYSDNNLNGKFIQQSISFNPISGTLRGMHFQRNPYEEDKLIRVTAGSIFDVVVDLRKSSKSFLKYYFVLLSSKNRKQLYVPKGFAHGFQTLEANTEVVYQMTEKHIPEYSDGFLWSDQMISIPWPNVETRIIGLRDSSYLPLDLNIINK
jgi:dTDP-4-dehydrorhamnose 3,5-epimerase